MKRITEGVRVYLREFMPGDGMELYALNADSEVLQFTGDSPFASTAEAEAFLQRYEDYRKYGIGRWAVIRKEDNAFLGWCGLKLHPAEGITEVGYRFFKKYWGQGYATEAAEASMDYGFFRLRLWRIYAHVHVDNVASLRVVEKLGMLHIKDFDYEGLPAKLFARVNPNYHLRLVDKSTVLEVRHPVLRSGRPPESAVFNGDELATTFHLGAYYESRLVGVATLMLTGRPGKQEDGVYQLRGMAIIDEYRGKGVGGALLNKAENEVVARGGDLIWMNAREKAVGFYKRAEYRTIGPLFDIPKIGPHFYMEKSLNSGKQAK
ncbi:GNAT family N-acetyltransferase [Robertkochia sediminum]|uniref:GNAT family N-acetyltransferase n=1 Tax=Robertkochia sediminum TaxID=2785326 RepID=UPI001933578E|nr:GNAT family N-acetyltransferase [Robertkochia sediminum]MBL7471687.1 GNAT family N-acetyltransferase [Robertkochia sediminum]